MATRDVIVIGGSAGSILPLRELLSKLPADLPAAVFVLVHRFGPTPEDNLIDVLQRAAAIRVAAAVDGERPVPSCVYLAPPGLHLRFERGLMRTGEVLARPASRSGIDELFSSAAESFGDRVIAVLLSGALSDGTAGSWDVRKAGGVTIIQAPHLAEFPSMPASAMREVPLHHSLDVDAIARELVARTTHDEPRRRPRVLIAEDERVLALNIETGLAAAGYDVVASVATAEDAVLVAQVQRPDVAIMDIHLAGVMPGTEAARRLWEELHIPIVYLTSYCDEQTMQEAGAAKPFGYIVKPFKTPQLHAAIRVALERSAAT